MASHIVLFLRKYIDSHESKFPFYLRKYVRNYGVYSNAIHEGTNNDIKYFTYPVKPIFVLSHTFELINTQAEMSNTRKIYEKSKQLHRINIRLGAPEYWLEVLLPEHASLTSIIPKMKHVRTVALFENKLTCSCCEMIVYSLPC